MMPVATTADGEAAASNPLAMSGESFASSLARWVACAFPPLCSRSVGS